MEWGTKRDWWKRGRGLDLWSIPHFLFGVLMAAVPPLTGMSFLSVFFGMLILALAWEAYEKLTDIKETTLNSFFDVVLSITSFTVTSYFLVRHPLHPHDLLVLTVAVFVLYLFTNISGWFAYRRRNRAFRN